MKKRILLLTATLAAVLTPLTGLAACKSDTSPTLWESDSQISAILPDADAPTDSEISSDISSVISSESTPETPPVPQNAQYIRCTGDSVNLRSGAGTGYAVLGTAEKNTAYVVLGKSGGWYKTYYRGKVAYISASYASVFTLEKADEQTEDVLEQGYKLIGVPYVYGAVRLHDGKGNFLKGFTAQKFDCSSLVQYVFYQGAGKLLDVTTRTQVKQGTYVSRSKLQRGDCIYFTNEERQNKTGVERIGHVAIYLGNDYILHTASDYARIEKMTAKRWSFYVEARRFL
ncbi:MAG: C40 family peptidase [Clostridia bacterium]|nr:C40 family peptidase [Clostridia bacterium]